MKLNHIVIPNTTDKTNEEIFADTMETYMGEIEIIPVLEFIKYYDRELGEWVKDVFEKDESYCKEYTDALYIEDDAGNITEYFILTEKNTIRHIIL